MTTPRSTGALPDAARALLERRAELAAGAASSRISRRSDRTRAPLSFAQQRLWLLDRMEPGNTSYVRARAFRIGGHLDVDALRRALSALVARHEALRAAVVEDDAGPYVAVREPRDVELVVCDEPLPLSDAEVEARLAAEARLPFDLASGTLLRASLVRVPPDDHTLFLTLHHVATDAWSEGIVRAELGALYAAFAAGRPSPLAEPPIGYGDYAAWQRERAASPPLERALAYWTNALAGAPPVLELPTDRARPARRGVAGARVGLELGAADVAAAAALATAERATLFMVLLAAWQATLARYAGRDDVVVGVPVAGRTRAEMERCVGLFVNTLPLRARFDGDVTFRELLARTRRATLDAYAHQELPFDRLVEALRPQRTAAHTPVVQTLFNFRNVPTAPLELPGLAVRQILAPELSVATDLDLTVTLEDAGGLACALGYATELFDEGTGRALLDSFAALLRHAVSHPDTRVSRLPLLAPADRDRLVHHWNLAAGSVGRVERAVHEIIAERAARSPHAVAVESADGVRRLDYAELAARASALAARLRAAGAGPGDRVAVCVERSLDLVVALLGVLESGAAYVPLDPDYPPARLALLCDDAAPAALLVSGATVGRLPAREGVALIRVDDAAQDAARGAPPTPGDVRATLDDVAYVIYTSGSTGTPKGVEITHRSLATYALAAARRFGFAAGDRVLQFATVSFDTAVREIYATLVAGATIVLRPPGPLATMAETLEHWRERGVTVACLPTAFWHELASALADRGGLALPDTLHTVTAGGERMRPDRVALWRRATGGRVRLFNNYGPTETTVTATAYELPATAAPDDELRPVPIGRPLPDVRVYVLDAAGEPVPPGAVGELVIGGAGVARGYHGRPDLTAQRFGPDPLSDAAGARRFRSGDLVRLRADGELEFIGRDDDQAKIRGFRVEPAEAEAALGRDPSVRQAAVVVRADGPDGAPRLVAYVVPADGAVAADAEGDAAWHARLREGLRARLPEFAVPSAFRSLDALPLMPNGKVDRAALPAPAPPAAASPSPGSALEERIAALWCELLELPRVGRDDDFFDVGGHSLAAVALAGRMSRLFGDGPWLAALLEAPTVARLARAVEERRASPETPLQRVVEGERGVAPLFFLHGDREGGGVYMRAVARRLDPRRPLYVIHPPLPDGPDNVPAMVAAIVPLVRGVQPRGPYHLGGYCNGGVMAYELAQQLVGSGEEVASLVVVDAALRNAAVALPYRALSLACRLLGIDARRRDAIFLAHREPLVRLSPRGQGGKPAGWGAWLAVLVAGLGRVGRRRLSRGVGPAAAAAESRTLSAEERRAAERTAFYEHASGTYLPRPFDGAVTLLLSSDWATREGERLAGEWRALCPRVSVRVVPGTHRTVVSAGRDILGPAIRAALGDAPAEASAP